MNLKRIREVDLMSEWIRVKDRLPEDSTQGVHDSKKYLVFMDDGGSYSLVSIKTWMNNRWEPSPMGALKITHWMPFPDAPDGSDD